MKLSLNLTTFGLPMIAVLAIKNRAKGHHSVLQIATIFGVWYLLVLLWTLATNLDTTIDAETISRSRGVGPLRRTIKIGIEEIESVEMLPYSGKLVVRSRNGQEVVVANRYSYVGNQVPDVPEGPGDAGGYHRTLRRIRHLIETRRSALKSGSPNT